MESSEITLKGRRSMAIISDSVTSYSHVAWEAGGVALKSSKRTERWIGLPSSLASDRNQMS